MHLRGFDEQFFNLKSDSACRYLSPIHNGQQQREFSSPIGVFLLLTSIQYIVAMRLFKEEPKWTPLNRGPEVDVNPYRKEYLHTRAAIASQ